MITVVVTGAHRDTHQILRDNGRVDLQVRTYQHLLRRSRLPRATYIFTDFDRLSDWELELVSHLYQTLTRQGGRVLNDPARVRQRFSLLRTLHDRGLNAFNVWRVEDTLRPERFPVFLRLESGHRGPVSELLHDPDAVEQAVEAAMKAGCPRRLLILVEYCAEPVAEGVYRKYAMFRVGNRLVPELSVNERRWWVKHGEQGVAGEAWYAEEEKRAKRNPDEAVLREAFEAGDIEYGRADYGLVKGCPQVYEINTNPMVSRFTRHPFPARVASGTHAWTSLLDAFEAVDSLPGTRFTVDDERLAAQRRHDRWMTRPRWVH